MFKLRSVTGSLVKTVNFRNLISTEPSSLLFTRLVNCKSLNHFSTDSSLSKQPNVSKNKRNKETLFIDSNVQRILQKITGYNEERIFSNKPVSGYKPPKYLFLTDEELEITHKRALEEGKKNLQMPPVMEPWEDKDYILANEPEFSNFDYCNLVITDLSQGFTDRSRLIAVREPNGILRRARWDERYRMNQTYFPVPGRQVTIPKMFEPEHLEPVLNRFDYLFVLDRACIQFEPDDPRYIEIVTKTYDHINANKKFNLLRSTRHFGPMAFHLAFEGKIDALLQDMIKRELLDDAASLIQLYYIINPNEKRKPVDFSAANNIEIIKIYLSTECKERYLVETALRTYQEIMAAREDQPRMSGHG
ncbi:28S ribosomal protein S22, mitochondrial [Tetranychus urticae]|uniref:28S ribosomal protein S22, mitochondrial n=1 Tax=Tetranychus urticae TaxID=32264 RepID=T1K229_TETUR|nr:28S ribosomal protein S22, mitochondrial [Tetranychus urticae]